MVRLVRRAPDPLVDHPQHHGRMAAVGHSGILRIWQKTNIGMRVRRDRAFAQPPAGTPMSRRTAPQQAFQSAGSEGHLRVPFVKATRTSAGQLVLGLQVPEDD